MVISADPPLKPPKAKKGCFFYGCLTLVILALVVFITGFFAVRYGLRRVAGFIEQYTEATAMTLPTSQMPAGQFAELRRRYDEFKTAIQADRPTPPLVLSGDDINALIAGHPDWSDAKGNAFVTITGDELSAQVSIPMDKFAAVPLLGGSKGRYLNGSASVGVTTIDGKLQVTLKSLEVKGIRPPDEMMVRIQTRNLVENYQRPNSAMSRLGSVEVADGKLTVQGKP